MEVFGVVVFWKELMCQKGASKQKEGEGNQAERYREQSNDVDFVRYAIAFGFYAKYDG